MENLTVKWKTWNDDKKLRFIKNITVELYVTTKKELYIQENKLFELIKVFNLKNGAPDKTSVGKTRKERELSPLCLYIISNYKKVKLFSEKIKEANF